MKKLFGIALIAMVSISITTASAKQKSNATVTTVSTTKQTVTTKSNAQQPKTIIVTSQFQTNIDNSKDATAASSRISKIDGVMSVDVNQRSSIVTVRYNNQQTNETEILKTFKKIKIDAKVKK